VRRKRNFRRAHKTIAILGEGLTEYLYFTGLKKFEGLNIKIKPDKPKHSSSLLDIEKKIEELFDGFDEIFVVIDLDRIITNEKEFQKYSQVKRKYQNKPEIHFIESLPYFELWYLLHYKFTTRHFANCDEPIKELKKHIDDYTKTKDYYSFLKEYQLKAIKNSKKLEKTKSQNPSKFHPKTDIYQIIESILKLKLI